MIPPTLQDELTTWAKMHGMELSPPEAVVDAASVTAIPEPGPSTHAEEAEKPDARLVIAENDRFLLYMNTPESDHGPAHVHLLMKHDPEFELKNGKQKARFALVQSQADIFREDKKDARYAVTMPYYDTGVTQEDGTKRFTWYLHPKPLPYPFHGNLESAEREKRLPRVNSYRFNLAGDELQQALDFVNGHIDDCIAKWTELYRDTPEEHDFVTPQLLEGVNFARRIRAEDLTSRGRMVG